MPIDVPVDQIVLAPGWLYYDHDLGYGPCFQSGAFFLSPVSGTDVDPQQHYYQPDLTVFYRVPAYMTTPWIHYRVRCRSTAATGNKVCTIKQGYGSMTGVIISGATLV